MDPLLLHELEMEGRDGGESAVRMADGQYNLDLDLGINGMASTGNSTGTGTGTGNSTGTGDPHIGALATGARFVWDGEDPAEYGHGTGRGWLRISDDSVRECGIENVLAEGSSAFMLYYERVVVDVPGVYPSRRVSGGDERDRVGVPSGVEVGDGIGSADGVEVGRDSEETLRPRTKTVVVNGSANSLVTVGVGVMKRPSISISTEGSSSGKPRIIRSVDAGRKKSVPPSTTPSPTERTFVSPSVSTSTLASREQSVVSSTTSGSACCSSNSIKGPTSSPGQLPNGTPHACIPLSLPTAPLETVSQPSPSPSRPKPNTLKRKSKLSHSAGKKPPSIQLQHP